MKGSTGLLKIVEMRSGTRRGQTSGASREKMNVLPACRLSKHINGNPDHPIKEE